MKVLNFLFLETKSLFDRRFDVLIWSQLSSVRFFLSIGCRSWLREYLRKCFDTENMGMWCFELKCKNYKHIVSPILILYTAPLYDLLISSLSSEELMMNPPIFYKSWIGYQNTLLNYHHRDLGFKTDSTASKSLSVKLSFLPSRNELKALFLSDPL